MTPVRPTITDVCLVTRDIEAAIEFYVERLGYRLRSRMPQFADFEGPGLILALWDASAIVAETGVSAMVDEPTGRNVMLACELGSPEEVDAVHARLESAGVALHGLPADYPWNARCIYFDGPCGEFWEFFAWLEGGMPGLKQPSSEAP